MLQLIEQLSTSTSSFSLMSVVQTAVQRATKEDQLDLWLQKNMGSRPKNNNPSNPDSWNRLPRWSKNKTINWNENHRTDHSSHREEFCFVHVESGETVFHARLMPVILNTLRTYRQNLHQ